MLLLYEKKPARKFGIKYGLKPYVATMAEESEIRKNQWLKYGCNIYDGAKAVSKPMSFWTEQDVLQYIKENHIEIASIYGEIKTDESGKLYTTGYQRTGCIFCGFGCHLEKEPNRFQRLKETHPKQYNYCINGGEYDKNGIWKPNKEGLGMAKVLDYIGVKY